MDNNIIHQNNNQNNNQNNDIINRKKRWTSNEMTYLLTNFKDKKSINEMALTLKRTPLAVEIKLQNYILNNQKNMVNLVAETGLSEDQIKKYIDNIKEKKEIYGYVKKNNLFNISIENVKKLYKYDTEIPKMKQLVEYAKIKEKLLQLVDHNILSKEEYESLNLNSYSEQNYVKIHKVLEYYLMKKEIMDLIDKKLLSKEDYVL